MGSTIGSRLRPYSSCPKIAEIIYREAETSIQKNGTETSALEIKKE